MKIAIRGGHVPNSTGAIALINELTEDRKVKDSVIKYLKELGHTVLDVTPPDSTPDTNSDLAYGVNKANSWGADLFISIHFNKAYNSYTGAIGTETWVYSKTDNIKLDEEVAQRIVNCIAGLGFKNRGVKERIDLYELHAAKMASVIVEVCFVEATEDVALYKKLGADLIGKSIAESISNKKINDEIKKEDKKVKGIVIYSNDIDRRGAEYLADYLGLPTISSSATFDFNTVDREGIYAVGGSKNTYTSYLLDKNFIAGSDRYETVKAVLKRIGKL